MKKYNYYFLDLLSWSTNHHETSLICVYLTVVHTILFFNIKYENTLCNTKRQFMYLM